MIPTALYHLTNGDIFVCDGEVFAVDRQATPLATAYTCFEYDPANGARLPGQAHVPFAARVFGPFMSPLVACLAIELGQTNPRDLQFDIAWEPPNHLCQECGIPTYRGVGIKDWRNDLCSSCYGLNSFVKYSTKVGSNAFTLEFETDTDSAAWSIVERWSVKLQTVEIRLKAKT